MDYLCHFTRLPIPAPDRKRHRSGRKGHCNGDATAPLCFGCRPLHCQRSNYLLRTTNATMTATLLLHMSVLDCIEVISRS